MDIQWLYYGCNSCEAGFRLSGINGAAMGFFVSVATLLIIFVIGIFKDIIKIRP